MTNNKGETLTSDSAMLIVGSLFDIISQPQNYGGPVNATAEFHVEAVGSGLTYQWQFSKNNRTWTNSTSATQGYNTDTLHVIITNTRNGYYYRCIVTDGSGESIVSDAARLTVVSTQ